MNDSNHGIIRIVVISIAGMAFVCVLALAFCLVTGREMEQSIGMAFFGVTNALTGYLAGCLSRTVPSTSGKEPVDATIVNTKFNPVPTDNSK